MTDSALQHRNGTQTLRARVAIVEDHDLLSQSLAFALANMGIEVMTVPDLRPNAVVESLEDGDFDIVLLDFDLGDAGTGLDLVRPLAELGLRVVMLTGETNQIRLAQCIEAGAVGIISKTEPFERLIEHVDDVVTGRSIMSVSVRERMLSDLRAHRASESERLAPFARLTVRESEVLQDLIEGKNAERIATESYVSIATVRSHIKSLLAKLGVNSQLAAVALAQRAGWAAAHERPEGVA